MTPCDQPARTTQTSQLVIVRVTFDKRDRLILQHGIEGDFSYRHAPPFGLDRAIQPGIVVTLRSPRVVRNLQFRRTGCVRNCEIKELHIGQLQSPNVVRQKVKGRWVWLKAIDVPSPPDLLGEIPRVSPNRSP